ncbi:ABC transporter permease [Methyloterricola oryzae]|uniref:ABC transporter permease n=1 Tax=Methyloterricola oryzae TaxID=1495050 RepID=UPI0005EB8EF4|nr:ABC transporter permease [Methyloterricola oryzae]
MSILARANRRYFVRHPVQLLLAVIGVALGVAIVAAIDLAAESTHRAFALSMQAITGRYTHQITAGSTGLDESLYRRLRIEQGLRQSAPSVEAYVRAGNQTLRLVGFDPYAERGTQSRFVSASRGGDATRLLTEPGSALIASVTARQLGVAPGNRLDISIDGRAIALDIIGYIEGNGPPEPALEGLLLTDIASAQELLGRVGRLDRIELILPEYPEAAEQLRRWLPVGTELETIAGRNASTQKLSAALELNLRAMSWLALLVGAFLIYNTMAFSVLQRRELLASLRVLGATRGQLFREVLQEAALLGLAGGLLGLAFGVLAAKALLHLVTRSINDLYFVLTVTEFLPDPLVLARGLAMGIAVAMLAAAAPAWEAARTSQRPARSGAETSVRKLLPGLAVLGLLLLSMAAWVLQARHVGLTASIGGVFMLLSGFGLITPWLMLMLTAGTVQLARLGDIWLLRLALSGVAASLSRAGLAVAALTVAVAVSVGVGIMIESFRGAITDWLEEILQADIYVTGASTDDGLMPNLPDNLESRLADIPGLARTGGARRMEVKTSMGNSELLVLRPPDLDQPGFRFKSGDGKALWRSFPKLEAVMISEPYAQRHDLSVGDHLVLQSDSGPVDLPVAGVFFDYRSDQGLIIMHRALYQRYWSEPRETSLGLYLEPGADLASVRRETERRVAEDSQVLTVKSNREIRDATLKVFDRTFAITQVLRLLAMGVAFVGILSALMAFQFERRRELAVLRATGLTPRETGGLMLLQTGFMGLVAGLLSIPLGLAIALALVRVIHLRSFGWTMELSFSPSALISAVAMSLAAALLAGLYPAHRVMMAQPARALREE